TLALSPAPLPCLSLPGSRYHTARPRPSRRHPPSPSLRSRLHTARARPSRRRPRSATRRACLHTEGAPAETPTMLTHASSGAFEGPAVLARTPLTLIKRRPHTWFGSTCAPSTSGPSLLEASPGPRARSTRAARHRRRCAGSTRASPLVSPHERARRLRDHG